VWYYVIVVLPVLGTMLLATMKVQAFGRAFDSIEAAALAVPEVKLPNASELVLLDDSNSPSDQAPEVLFHNGMPSGLLLRDDGALFISDRFNKVVWLLRPNEKPEIFVGRIGPAGPGGEPEGGYNDAAPENSAFMSPRGLAEFLDGYILSDTDNHVLRIFDDEKVYTAVGSGTPGFLDGYSVETGLNRPAGVAADGEGNIYIADTGNHAIRVLDRLGNLSTFAGGEEGCADGNVLGAVFRSPMGLCWHDGALYVADSGNHRICRIEGGIVSVVAGPRENPPVPEETFEHGGHVDGSASEAMFSNPQGVTVTSSGSVYVADTGNHAVRKISGGLVSTLRVIDESSDEVYPVSPVSVINDSDTLYIADEFAGIVFRVTAE
jgi:sugar lactone lactonase YvrE